MTEEKRSNMFQRVLITGSGGMLGTSVYPYFKERYPEILATDLSLKEPWLQKLDIRDTQVVSELFEQYKPDLVLHLAALVDMEICERLQGDAEATNATATRHIAELAAGHGATLVYISTGGVFDGEKEGAYTEDDPANPIAVYGQTKYDGEVHVREVNGNYYVIRPGWMVGGGKARDRKFVRMILEQIREGRPVIHAVNDKWGTPTYAHDFTINLFKLLESRQYGTYHMVCKESGTRYDVAKWIVDVCRRPDIEVKPVNSDFFMKEFFAPRPRMEILVNKNLERLGINLMRPWKEAIGDYISSEFPDYIASDSNGRVRGRQSTG